jgi:Pyrimidine dimer DNA glycosylase
VQTFIPCTTFEDCAKVLDYRRLGKQRVECKQILDTLAGKSSSWKNHPAVKMWAGYEEALRQYQRQIILEWMLVRGYKNNMEIPERKDCKLPPWWGGPIHASHRSALLEKNFEYYYGNWGWEDEPKIEYIWPCT